MTLGLITTVTLLTVWVVFRFMVTRQKHIVLHFSTPTEDPDLAAAASILTHHFVNHIQRIGRLLANRQVESVNLRTENPLTLFVTSGHEEELVRQLGTMNDLEISNIKFPIGRLISILVINLALTRVAGRVQRNEDGTLEVWVEVFSRRPNRYFELGRIVIHGPINKPSSESALNSVAEELAIQLAYHLGQSYLLATSWQSLRWFVTGLEASKKRNWWYAIANYQKATAYEEAQRGSFGIGHYHIGATLLSQGEPRLALLHLRQAESSGPVSAETHYMLAQNLLALSYDKLETINKGERLQTRIENILAHLYQAIRLRPEFPEAFHLLGVVHYQIARNDERRAREFMNHDLRIQERRTKLGYVRSLMYFRTSLHMYDKIFKRIEKKNDVFTDTEPTKTRIIRERMIAKHHLADALSNLVDQAMTFCSWQQWDQATELIDRKIFTKEYTKWNADS